MLQGEMNPSPTLQILHGADADDLTGQKLFGRQSERDAGLPQNEPASQSTSEVDPSGQCEPSVHSICCCGVGQCQPAGHANGSVDSSGQCVPDIVHCSLAPPEQ
jgi:hypothetical protein